MKILFGTTNVGKLKEARGILGPEVEVESTSLEVEEIQSLDPVEVATHKVKEYFKQLKQPVFIDDVSLTFLALEKFPGTYINDFLKVFGPPSLAKLLNPYDNRSAVAQTTIAFASSEKEIHTFEGVIPGTIAQAPRGEGGHGWDPIFIPDGYDKTFAEMSLEEKNQISMRALALKKFKQWLADNHYL